MSPDPLLARWGLGTRLVPNRNLLYTRQEGVGFKGWGDTEVATARREYKSKACVKLSFLWLDAIICFAVGKERSIVAHSGSVTPGKHKTEVK